MFIYAVLGMELFSYTLVFNDDNQPIPIKDKTNIVGHRPPWNFDSFFEANMIVFILLANDGWTSIFFDYYRVVGWETAVMYFLTFFIIG